MKIERAPDEFHVGFDPGFSPNSLKFFVITFENRTEAQEIHPKIQEWCHANCTSHWSMFPLVDPRWDNVLTQGILGFADPSEAMLFRLNF